MKLSDIPGNISPGPEGRGTDERPSPEDFLAVAQEEERKKVRGELTIYVGYAAGVGKTYGMLLDALQRKAGGTDVVIGYVETHGRVETDALAARLPGIPTRTVHYEGMDLREPDIDAIIARRPEIVLIDELAHTDAPGLRHKKRFQDVEELQNAGISVYTTMNIQHLESQNDALLQITGIQVQETVPDSVVRGADHLKLIDVPPDELQKRLQEGKVYVKDMANDAIVRFFEEGNLMALRQLTLRQVAGMADQRLLRHMRMKAVEGPWPATERVLVGIRPGPYAERMVRAAYRMSMRLNAEWEVLFVETPDEMNASDQEKRWIDEALSTAHKLGGHIVRFRGANVADEVIRYARAHNVTMIILGKPRGLDILISPVYRIMRATKGIDIYLFDWKAEFPIPFHQNIPLLLPRHYLMGLVGVVAVTLLNYFLLGTISEANMLILQLLPVVLVAYFFGRGASVFTAIMSVLVFDFVFVRPYFTLTVHDWEYFISFIGYVFIALLVSYLATRLRYVVQQVWRSEVKVSAVSGLSKELAEAGGRREVLDALLRQGRSLGAEKVTIFIPSNGLLGIKEGDRDYPSPEKEDMIAEWAYENGLPAGRGTDTLPNAAGTYIPLKAQNMKFGVMGFFFPAEMHRISPDTLEMLETIGRLGALSLEKIE
ncbi:two-component system sensor histidine kinase KdpD [Methanolinea mesophila]|uniref:DUF4118 domain-containing protein n=1 Tax=Methanolinea mesophila TaxID=547055 RepID=UPI001AEA2E49|nr:DUF4118 domain-containing protein [Methanolinea mesophila]MBP1927747.1 two-component system sensor histidine kinase KdpD [Methanolinea mesophila]